MRCSKAAFTKCSKSRRAVRGVRLGEQFGDLLLQQHHLFDRMTVADRAVLARVGEDLRPIQRESHIAHTQHADARRHFEHLVKAAFKQRAVFPPERAVLSWSGCRSAHSSRTATFSWVSRSMRRLLKVPVA